MYDCLLCTDSYGTKFRLVWINDQRMNNVFTYFSLYAPVCINLYQLINLWNYSIMAIINCGMITKYYYEIY